MIEGRPLWRRRRRKQLLPDGAPSTEAGAAGSSDLSARAEYASVAAFGELALRLLAVGAPSELVAACHRAALDEIRHSEVVDELAGRRGRRFGAIPHLLGRRIGSWTRSRRSELRRLAVESFLDGWVNEGAAAAELRNRAAAAPTAHERELLLAMAEDEERHAELGRAIATWCFEQEPSAVGRALGAAAEALPQASIAGIRPEPATL